MAEGAFYGDAEANIIMGPAVADAVAWYDKADWIGIHATPRTSLVISQHVETQASAKSLAMIDYAVPLTGGGTVQAKAINWARAFFLRGISPCEGDEDPRAKLIELLTVHQMPKGTESKYFNTLTFFDSVAEDEMAKKAPRKKQ